MPQQRKYPGSFRMPFRSITVSSGTGITLSYPKTSVVVDAICCVTGCGTWTNPWLTYRWTLARRGTRLATVESTGPAATGTAPASTVVLCVGS